jgi:hypothetical protein
VGSFIFFPRPQEKRKAAPKPQPPQGFALQLRRPGAEIEIRGVGVRGERATSHKDLLLRRSGCPVFCLRQAAAAKKQENRPLKKTKKTFYIAQLKTRSTSEVNNPGTRGGGLVINSKRKNTPRGGVVMRALKTNKKRTPTYM